MEFKRLSEEELQCKLIEFQEIIAADEKMPKNIDKTFLLRFLKFFNGNIEKALKRLTSNMQLRTYYSNIFLHRDTESARFRNVIQRVDMILLPKLTPDNHRIILTRLIDCNPDNVIFEDVLSVSSMLSDVNLILPDDSATGKIADGEILIYDLNGLTAKHLTKLGFSSMRGFFRYMIEAHPMRIKEIHLINCSSLLDKIVMIIKPFIGSKAMNIMHFHTPNSTTLFDFVPHEILPLEIGGTDESYENTRQYWVNKTEEHREFLMNDDLWTIKENEAELTEEDSYAYMGFC